MTGPANLLHQKKKSTEKHRKSCDSARAMWNRRIGNKVMENAALMVGKHCMASPCSGRPSNDWRCQDGPKPKNPPPSKSTKEQRTSCKAARGMWAKRNEMKGSGRLMLQTMALRVGSPCISKGCEGNPQNNWTCQDSPPPPPPPPAKSTAGQRKSCKAAKILWEKRNMKGKLGLAMRTKAMQMGLACNMKPCSGGPANDWKCQDEPVKEGFTPACSDKEQKEITRLENRLKAAKKRCENTSAFPADNFQNPAGFREGFREGQSDKERADAAAAARRQWQANQRAAANARANQAAAARRQQAALAARARAAQAQQAAAARQATLQRAQNAENRRRARFRSREVRLDTDARRAPKASPEQLASCAAAAAACSKSCTPLQAGRIARGVGRACTAPPCYGGPQNNWKCITSLDNTMNVQGATGAQQTSCTAARGFYAKRNEDVAMLARAMAVGRACNACGGNPENNYTCTASRQAKANQARTAGATAAKVAGAAAPRCTKCDASTIVRNLGDQYKNDPNICKTRKDEAQCADAGGLWNDEKPSNSKKEEGTGDWKVEIDEKSGDLVFNHKGQTKSKLTKTGEWSSDSRKCGT